MLIFCSCLWSQSMQLLLLLLLTWGNVPGPLPLNCTASDRKLGEGLGARLYTRTFTLVWGSLRLAPISIPIDRVALKSKLVVLDSPFNCVWRFNALQIDFRPTNWSTDQQTKFWLNLSKPASYFSCQGSRDRQVQDTYTMHGHWHAVVNLSFVFSMM